MNEHGVRQLLHESAADEVLGPPGVDLDRVVAAGRRSVAWRRAVVGALATGVLGAAVAVPVMLSTTKRPADIEVGGVVPSSAPAASASAESRSIVDVVKGVIPGADVSLNPLTGSGGTATLWEVAGGYFKNGKKVAVLSLTAHAEAGPDEVGDPCKLRPGDTAGRQGAPAPDDRCTPIAQPDGTKVWIWRMGKSPARPWTTSDTRQWEVRYHRADGVMVFLSITNTVDGKDGPAYLKPKFSLTDAQLLAVVTAPEVRQLF